jgi:hypothetical protein
MKKILILLLMLISITAFSQKKKEVYFQLKFANAINGDNQIILNDNSIIDVLTDTFAIEVDYGEKWAESIGNTLYISAITGKKAGVLLILDGENEQIYLKRLMAVAIKYNITVWTIDYKTDRWRKIDL